VWRSDRVFYQNKNSEDLGTKDAGLSVENIISKTHKNTEGLFTSCLRITEWWVEGKNIYVLLCGGNLLDEKNDKPSPTSKAKYFIFLIII